jgi:hypothetical protein
MVGHSENSLIPCRMLASENVQQFERGVRKLNVACAVKEPNFSTHAAFNVLTDEFPRTTDSYNPENGSGFSQSLSGPIRPGTKGAAAAIQMLSKRTCQNVNCMKVYVVALQDLTRRVAKATLGE